MRVLVTGGAGFIGSHVVDALVEGGEDVVVLDRAGAGSARARDGSVEWIDGDVRDEAVWRKALHGVDAVSHQAARVGLGVDFDDVLDYVDDNGVGTAAGLRALHRLGFRGRIVLAGSMVVYGEGRYRCARHGEVRVGPRPAARLDAGRFEPGCPHCGADLAPEPVGEDALTDPRNVYAATKLHQEHLVAAYVREHPGASAVSLRYHNVYGPRMPADTPYAGVAAIFRSALAAGRPPQVFEDGAQTRDFVHVADVAAANLLAMRGGPIAHAGQFVPLNVCSGRAVTILEVAQSLSRAVGGPPPVVTGRWRPGDVRHVVAEPSLAEAVLQFRARVGLDEGLGELAGGSGPVPAGRLG